MVTLILEEGILYLFVVVNVSGLRSKLRVVRRIPVRL